MSAIQRVQSKIMSLVTTLPKSDRERAIAALSASGGGLIAWVASLYASSLGVYVKDVILDSLLAEIGRSPFSFTCLLAGVGAAFYAARAQIAVAGITPRTTLQHSAVLGDRRSDLWTFKVKVHNGHPTKSVKVVCNQAQVVRGARVFTAKVEGADTTVLEPETGKVFEFVVQCPEDPPMGLVVGYTIHLDDEPIPVQGGTEVARLYKA